MKTIKILFAIFLALFCSFGLSSCAREREIGVTSMETLSVIPGYKTAHFKLDAKVPALRIRPYALKVYDVTFTGGGLNFADMNEGQWEFSINGNKWHPLILSGEEFVLKEDVSAGESILSLRATDELALEASGGELNFKLKLERSRGFAAENLAAAIMWTLLGIIINSALVLAIYAVFKGRINKKAGLQPAQD